MADSREYVELDWTAIKNDQRSIDELVQVAVTEKDEKTRWEAVAVLRSYRPPREVFEIARELVVGCTPAEREVGADVLAQLGYHGEERPLGTESATLLLDVLTREVDLDVIYSIICALGHLDDERAIDPLVRFADHPDADLRFGVAWALNSYNGDMRAVDALIRLSSDVCDDVRNWATFGLGEMGEVDTHEVREALFARLEDEVDEVRAQSLLGLAKFGDQRVVEPLVRELEAASHAESYWEQLTQAAQHVADERILPELIALREHGFDDSDLRRAIAMHRIPNLDEIGDEPDGAPTTCPVCGLKNAYPDPDGWDICPRCRWQQDAEQLENPDETDGRNPRSLNAERVRWRERVERATGHSEISANS